MAPRKDKDKTEKTSDEDGSRMVLGYLKRQNRPYSAIDISANLHNKVTKAQTVKLLKELADKDQIYCKASGKHLVYHSIQPELDESSSPEAIAGLDQEITSLRSEVLPGLQAREKALRVQLNALTASMSLNSVKEALQASKQQKEGLTERLGPLREGTVKPVSDGERREVDEASRLWEKRMKARAKIAKALWEMVWERKADEGTKKEMKEEVWEELGCEGAMP